MLQAIIKHKFRAAISDGRFKPIEDTLTSSVMGLMQYLPDGLFWNILRCACGHSSNDLPESIGMVKAFHFWEHFSAKGTTNSKLVEPDVWIETEGHDIIMEVKRSDNSVDNSQYKGQWSNQILALLNSGEKESPKPIIYIAIGGNDSLHDSSIVIRKKEYTIHTASWYNLLNGVLNELAENHHVDYPANTQRILQDIVQALQVHGFFKTIWFDSLPEIPVTAGSDVTLTDAWAFDNRSEMSAIHMCPIDNETDLSKIWTITK